MINMVIRTYHEKCLDEKEKYGWYKVDKGNYVLRNVVFYPNQGGYKDIKEFNNGVEISNGKFRINLGTQYGINSYQEITFEETI
jgi:hypothetical protein